MFVWLDRPGISRGSRGTAVDAVVLWVTVPEGVVTVIISSKGSADTSIRYPTGRKVLNP